MINVSSLLLSGLLLAGATQTLAQTFASADTYACKAGSSPVCVAVSDVNGDGKLDALVISCANFNAADQNGTLNVLLGNGNGGFALQTALTSTGGEGPTSMVVVDVNNDNKPDILVTNYSNSTLGVLLGDGHGGFTTQANSVFTGGYSSFSLAVGDVNGDNKPDVLVAHYGNNALGVLLGDGKGGFTVRSNNPATVETRSTNRYIAAGDVNVDGKLDAVVTGVNPVSVLLGDGGGNFMHQATASVVSAGNIALVDVNKDGKLDIVEVGGYQFEVLLGDGNGSFTAQPYFPNISDGGGRDLAVTDINSDGNLDVLIINSGFNSNSLDIRLGDGRGGFTFQPNPRINQDNSFPNSIVAGDVNGDGKPDVLVANRGTNTLGVLLNNTFLYTRVALPGATVSLAPNPATSSATLRLAGLPATVAQIQATLLDATGRVVRQQTLAANQGSTRAEVVTAGLGTGLYLLYLATQDAQGQPAGGLPTQRLSVW